jgi:DHA2 family multidrug resistance protein
MQILNPIFLQELLGYTAMQAGLAMAPRGVGVMISMFFVGSIARYNLKTRPSVIVGILLLALGTWNLASLNLSMSIYNFVWATFIQGIGLGLVFPDISATALGSVSREEIGHAASLFSMTRNIGGSIGTSVLTTMLVRHEQVRQDYLVGHISVFDAWRVSKAPARMPGTIHFDFLRQLVTGQKVGLRLFYLQVQNQAMMLALNDIYGLVCGVLLISTLLCVLLPARVPRLRVDEMAH